MHPRRTRERALALLDDGQSLGSVARELGVSRAAIREWRSRGLEPDGRDECPVRTRDRLATADYSALLGYYLGDGCVSRLGRTFSLRVTCDQQYARIINDVAELIISVRSRGPVNYVPGPRIRVRHDAL